MKVLTPKMFDMKYYECNPGMLLSFSALALPKMEDRTAEIMRSFGQHALQGPCVIKSTLLGISFLATKILYYYDFFILYDF